jgi:uncharacterized membrane protein
MNSSVLKTKTFWGGIATIATGIGLMVTGHVPEGAQTLAIGVLAVFGRDAVAKLEN